MKNNEVCFITSFNKRLLKEYATKFLESYNLPFDLFIYSEDFDLDVIPYVKHIQSVKTECLFEDKEFKQFIDEPGPNELKSRYNFGKCDKTCKKYCCEHDGNGPKCEKITQCKTKSCKKFRATHTGLCVECAGGVKEMVKITKIFSYKVFSIINCFQKYPDYKYYIWIDADTKIKKQFDAKTLHKVVNKENDYMMAYLKRSLTYLEAGFIIFNRGHQECENYLRDMRQLYLSHDVYYLQQTHDAFVWHLMKDRYSKKGVKMFGITHESAEKNKGKNINILEKHPLLSKHLHHFKGGTKKDMKK